MEMRILNKRTFGGVHSKSWIRYLVPCAVIAFFIVFSFAVSSEDTVFGPKTYTRTSAPFNVFQESFSIADVNSSFTVIVQNGDPAGGRLSSAKIVLNGAEIVKPTEFNQQVQEIRRTVVLREHNTLRVELQSKPGSFITISIVRDPTPVLSITSPLNGTVFRSQPITVEGTIDLASAQVTVNGVPAVVNGGRFIAQNVPIIRDGMNTITAVGTAPGGNTGQASIMVILDTMAPNIVIDSPSNGSVTPDDTISVSGMVSDVITPNPTVLVNDVPATVTNGTFLAMGVPLNMGDNQITATARDGVGNQSTASITVNRADLPGLKLQIISGQAQTALIQSSLPEPLRVKLVDAADNAVTNREVLFQVSRGDGSLRNSPPLPGQAGQRTLIVNTDGNGEAAVRFDLGSRSGPGNNRVQASVVGALSPVEFSATATSGAPDRIAIVPMSNQQTGVVNQPLGMPLACVVLDASGNPVAGVPVTFQITEGGGNFGGNPSFVEATGADGVAHAPLTLGPEPGTQNNAVAATFQGQTDPPVTFAASGRVPGLLGNTTFSGLVLDNGDLPLRNARAFIFGTDRSAVTDATGRFLITNVPPGAQRLLIDGSGIVDSQGRIFPGLEFDLNVIGGVENSLPMPIYLPPLSTDPQSVARITGPVTTPVTLQIPGIPQATLTLLAGTIVSNHDGPASAGNPITVRLSRVNNDRVPMPPPNGSVFTLAGTVQPAGTHFSIPARVCSPNTGLSPGAQVDIFSFDHDVGQFLSIGFATVSEDGSTVCSNPGFGINKAGWFGATPPPPPTTEPKNCRVTLTANPTQAQVGQQVAFTATTNPPGRTVTFGGDQGTNPVQNAQTLTTSYSTGGRKTVTARCEQSTASTSVDVCFNITFTAANAVAVAGATPSIPLGPGFWGFTFPENVAVTMRACRVGNRWEAVVVGMRGNYSKQVRLLPGVMEVTGPPPAGNSTMTNFCTQVTDLNALTLAANDWFMLTAVTAHEDVHATRFEPALEHVAPMIEGTIEALNVPDSAGMTEAQAIAQIRALPAFTAAITNAQQIWLAEILVRVRNDHGPGGTPSRSGLTYVAELGVLNPMIQRICNHARTAGWGACGVCPP